MFLTHPGHASAPFLSLADNPANPKTDLKVKKEKCRTQKSKEHEKMYKGRVWLNDFGRYHNKAKTIKDSDNIPLSLYNENIHNHRTVEIVFASQSPLKSCASMSSPIKEKPPLIEKLASPTIQRYATTMHFSPFVENISKDPKPVSSAQKYNVSPLSRPPAIDHQKPTIITSGWLKIEILEESLSPSRRHKKRLVVSSKNIETNVVVCIQSAEPYLLQTSLQEKEAPPFFDESDSRRSVSFPESSMDKSFSELGGSLPDLPSMPKASHSSAESKRGVKRKSFVTNKQIKGYTASVAIKKLCVENENKLNIGDSFINCYSTMKWEWAHIIAKTLEPSQAANPDNLVAMTNTLNTWMLFFETMAKVIAVNFPELSVHVKSSVDVFQEYRDIAKVLSYQIRCFYTDTRYIEIQRSFNIQKDNHKYVAPRVSDKFYLCRKFEECLKIAQDNKSSSHSDLIAELDMLVRDYQDELSSPSLNRNILGEEEELVLPPKQSMLFSFRSVSNQTQNDSGIETSNLQVGRLQKCF